MNVSIPLAFALAVVWRHRRSVSPPAVALGLAVSAKLLLWPLLVWTLATRRVRTTVLAILVGIGVTLAAWAAIGFAGLTVYPDLLRRLSEIQSENSYSLVGIAARLGLGEAAGQALTFAVGVGLLGLCVVFARRDDEVRSFTCAVTATLALSPIVWLHYLVVLLVPLAIARPRFSLIWLLDGRLRPALPRRPPGADRRRAGPRPGAPLLRRRRPREARPLPRNASRQPGPRPLHDLPAAVRGRAARSRSRCRRTSGTSSRTPRASGRSSTPWSLRSSCSMSLPGMDGMQLLKRLQDRFPRLPVIMMSGHAGIEAAVTTIKAGAYDFLEKPLHLEVLLDKVASALKHRPAGRGADLPSDTRLEIASADLSIPAGAVEVEDSPVPQRTLKGNVVLNGIVLLSGRNTGIILSPLGTKEGIVFQSLDGQTIRGHITSLQDFAQAGSPKTFSANSTTLDNVRRRVRTVEHLMAVLSMYGITNVLIKVDEEIPNVDGSAKDFCDLIET